MSIQDLNLTYFLLAHLQMNGQASLLPGHDKPSPDHGNLRLSAENEAMILIHMNLLIFLFANRLGLIKYSKCN